MRRIGDSLLLRGLTPSTPVAILSDNSVNHALLALGAMHAGIPVAPISSAYSLVSRDHAKLRAIFDLLRPGLVFAEDAARFAPALDAVGAAAIPLDALLDSPPGSRIDEAFAAVGPDTPAKILFTSGSTGMAKGVINTQRMLCSNQQSWVQIWPFLEATPPILCDWLPWNHTFGGNATFNMVLRNGGTLYVDGGKPAPGLIETTARNLREVAPTLYFNVPRGFDLLLPYLETDADLRRAFFSRLEILFYAGAALPQNLWNRLAALGASDEGGRLLMLSGWGSTETAPLAACVHYAIDRPGVIGNPAPGIELKLVPSGDTHEIRVRGPNVTPGYYRAPDLTREAFDEDGFYRIGDAMKLADPDDPAKGLVFDGRVAEDFKLQSGIWVRAGAVRLKLIAACSPLVQDAVITGHDREDVGALVFVNPAAWTIARPGRRGRAHAASLGAGQTAIGIHWRLDDADPPAGPRRAAVDRRQRDHRQGLHQPARGAHPARSHVDALHAGGPGAIVWYRNKDQRHRRSRARR